MKKILTLIMGAIMLNGCSHSLLHYNHTTPELDFQEFFDGDIKGWGFVQDWRGRVVSRFDVTMRGTWDGNEGTLDEHFAYYNNKIHDREWRIVKQSDGTYIGYADDVVGPAKGEFLGIAGNWNYLIDIEINGKMRRLRFKDWMWQMNDDVVINRAYIKKFGFKVAELTLFMQKE